MIPPITTHENIIGIAQLSQKRECQVTKALFLSLLPEAKIYMVGVDLGKLSNAVLPSSGVSHSKACLSLSQLRCWPNKRYHPHKSLPLPYLLHHHSYNIAPALPFSIMPVSQHNNLRHGFLVKKRQNMGHLTLTHLSCWDMAAVMSALAKCTVP